MSSTSRLRQAATRVGSLYLLIIFAHGSAYAQRNLAGAVRTRIAVERLNVLGGVLLITAHPDDENAALRLMSPVAAMAGRPIWR